MVVRVTHGETKMIFELFFGEPFSCLVPHSFLNLFVFNMVLSYYQLFPAKQINKELQNDFLGYTLCQHFRLRYSYFWQCMKTLRSTLACIMLTES